MNATLAIASWRVYIYERDMRSLPPLEQEQEQEQEQEEEQELQVASIPPPDSIGDMWNPHFDNRRLSQLTSDRTAVASLLLSTVGIAAVVKYGELWLDLPFMGTDGASMGALALIGIPSIQLACQYWSLSRRDEGVFEAM